jgi:hypothetical protein
MTLRAFHADMCKGDKTSLCHQNIKHKNVTKLTTFFFYLHHDLMLLECPVDGY